jgi:hypothetical protein
MKRNIMIAETIVSLNRMQFSLFELSGNTLCDIKIFEDNVNEGVSIVNFNMIIENYNFSEIISKLKETTYRTQLISQFENMVNLGLFNYEIEDVQVEDLNICTGKDFLIMPGKNRHIIDIINIDSDFIPEMTIDYENFKRLVQESQFVMQNRYNSLRFFIYTDAKINELWLHQLKKGK